MTTIQARTRETIASFVSRTAAYFHVNAAAFSMDKNTSFQSLISGKAEAVAALEDFKVRISNNVTAWSPTSTAAAKGRRLFRGHTFPAKVLQGSTMRGCPHCLRGDLKGQDNPAVSMAMRGHWLVPHVTLCLKHQHPMVTLWKESHLIERFDSAAHLALIAPNIIAGHFDEEIRDETDFDIWLDNRLEGHDEGNWLEQFPLHAACNFCLMLGTSLLRHEMSAPSSVQPEDYWGVYQMGFEVAKNGEKAIQDALMGLQTLPGGPHDGPKKIFPKMYERLAYDYVDDPDYSTFRNILRTHMCETWPLGVGDELLGEPVTERRLHSVRTAAQATGIDQRRLRKILIAKGVISETGLSYAWEIFDAQKAEEALRSATTLITAKAFAEGIGATRSQFDLLVSGGVLSPKLSSLDEVGTKAIWDPAEGVDFLESVFLGAAPLRSAQHGWEHIAKSAMRLKIGPEEIIRAIQSKRIVRIGNHADYDGYSALYVYHDEVCSILSPEPTMGQNIELFSKAVGIGQPRRMQRLISNGHTPATELENPKLKTRQRYVTREDADAFHKKFYTPRTMAQAYGRSWQAMMATLRADGISPFSPDGEDYGSLFERTLIDAKFK
ncbi:hypothetical protein A8B82_13560 [Sulfitobacter sp. EhC04]|nr:hypothetical protein A8B82_13560 [Sulfitobacter sp. EhC04]